MEITNCGARSTDSLLEDAMKEGGNTDPAKVKEYTGKSVHFDVNHSFAQEREEQKIRERDQGLRLFHVEHFDDKHAISSTVHSLAEAKIKHELIHAAIELAVGAEKAPFVNSLVEPIRITKEIVVHQKEVWESSDRMKAAVASDCGVVALARALEFEYSFKEAVSAAHPTAGMAATNVTLAILDSPMKQELQLRADKGFIDAAGYAKNAAKEISSLCREANSLRDQAMAAKAAGNHDRAKQLTEQMSAKMNEAANVELKHLAPVAERAKQDAAYGLGVQSAVFQAIQSELKGTPAQFDALFRKADERIRAAQPVQNCAVPVRG